MTWAWRICFRSGLLSAAAALAGQLGAGVFTARVELTDSREANVRRQQDYSGVAVWLEPEGGRAAAPPRHYTMAQRGKRFVPHVLVVPVGSTVDFPNFDPIFHNAFSSFAGQLFDIGLYPPGTSRSVQFRRAGVVHVFCNIHAAMSAVIVVVNSPYFAVSGRDGGVRIEGVKTGRYSMRVWHERADAEALRALARDVEIPASGELAPVRVAISEAGYIAVPHKDKYGRDYPPELGDPAYPGAKP